MPSKTVRIGKHYCIDRKELPFPNPHCNRTSKTETPENQFKSKAQKEGWKVIKGGWPDFLLSKNGSIAFVEVKSWSDGLKPNQKEILKILSEHGLNCFTWRPKKGFQKIKIKSQDSHVNAEILGVPIVQANLISPGVMDNITT